MAPLPARAGLVALGLLALGVLGYCAAEAGASPLTNANGPRFAVPTHEAAGGRKWAPIPDAESSQLGEPEVEVVLVVVPPGMEAAQDVVFCESRGDWNARNGDHWGGWQLHQPSHEAKALRRGWTWEYAMSDARRQTEIAVEIWAVQGWEGPWPSCAP